MPNLRSADEKSDDEDEDEDDDDHDDDEYNAWDFLSVGSSRCCRSQKFPRCLWLIKITENNCFSHEIE